MTGHFLSSQTIIKRGGPQSEDPEFRALYRNKFVLEVKAEYFLSIIKLSDWSEAPVAVDLRKTDRGSKEDPEEADL